jgi:hypothetical protein
MTEQHVTVARFYKGWDIYQQELFKIPAPLVLSSKPCERPLTIG